MTGYLRDVKLFWPAERKSVITSYFAEKRDYDAWGMKRKHEGIDIATLDHSEKYRRVLAAKWGVVSGVGYDPRLMGHWAELSHSTKLGQFYTRYHHLSDVTVIVGQGVGNSQVIGHMGDSGNATGIHLHFMVYVIVAGKPVALDPLWLLPADNSREANG